jgi:hypothetical protein
MLHNKLIGLQLHTTRHRIATTIPLSLATMFACIACYTQCCKLLGAAFGQVTSTQVDVVGYARIGGVYLIWYPIHCLDHLACHLFVVVVCSCNQRVSCLHHGFFVHHGLCPSYMARRSPRCALQRIVTFTWVTSDLLHIPCMAACK